MKLTREKLRDLLNDNVQGYRNCRGALDLADKIIAAEDAAQTDKQQVK